MHVRRALALAAALPLLLAGCSEDEPEPKMPEPSSSSSTPTPTAEPTKEQESPEEFIRRWQAAADEMVVSGDTEPFMRLSRGCQPCKDYADRISSAYQDGGSIAFDGSTVESIKQTEEDPPTFVVSVASTALRMNVPGQAPQDFPAAEQTYRMTVDRRGGEWVVRHYSVV